MAKVLHRLREAIRFYIAVPEFALILVILALFWRPVASYVLGEISLLAAAVTVPSWLSDLGINVVANLIAAALIAAIAFWVLGRLKRHALAGRFDAYDVVGGVDTPWGTIELRYELFAREPTMQLRLENNGVVIEGTGVVNKEQHLIGYYRERSDPVRRRYGAFMMVLDGNNSEYFGQYLFVDPGTTDVHVGMARWKRKP